MSRLLDRLPIVGRGRSGQRQRGPRQIVLALLGLVVLVAVGYGMSLGVLAVNGIPGVSYYRVDAVFDEADNVVKHNKVRINGVFVGQVIGTRVDGNKAIVELQLEKRIQPLKDDTQVRIRPQSAVGTRFIELYPGTQGEPLADGDRIPDSQTITEVPLDTVLDTLQARQRQHLRTMISQLGVGLAGRGEDVNVALQNLPPTLRHFGSVSRAITDAGGFEPFVRYGQGAANAADPVREDIGLGFDPQQRALQPFVSEGESLRSTLDEAPPALAAARAGLQRSSPLLRELDRFSAVAVPALEAGRPAFAETSRLLREGRAGLREVPRSLPLLRPATPAVLDLLDTVRPVLAPVDTALRAARPPLDELGPRVCDMQTWTRGWASVVSWGDEVSNYLRFTLVSPDPSSLSGPGGGTQPGIFREPFPAPCTSTSDRVDLR